jgi:hypothetical protein
MKMGTTRSPFPYDDATRHALQSVNLRRTAILHYASGAAVFPISQAMPINSGIDAMCRERTSPALHYLRFQRDRLECSPLALLSIAPAVAGAIAPRR